MKTKFIADRASNDPKTCNNVECKLSSLEKTAPMHVPPKRTLEDMITELLLASEAKSLPVVNYSSDMNIQSWLDLFEQEANSINLDDNAKVKYIQFYLPPEAYPWYCDCIKEKLSWTDFSNSLTSMFGKEPHIEAFLRRQELEAFKQGNLPLELHSQRFMEVIRHFPKYHVPSKQELRTIYVNSLSPKLQQFIFSHDYLKGLPSWLHVKNWAVYLDYHDLKEELPQLIQKPTHPDNLTKSTSNPTTIKSPKTTTAAVKLDKMKGNSRTEGRRESVQTQDPTSTAVFNPITNKTKSIDPLKLWAGRGIPICGHCQRIGHLSKMCYKTKRAPNASADTIIKISVNSSADTSSQVTCSIRHVNTTKIVYSGPSNAITINI